MLNKLNHLSVSPRTHTKEEEETPSGASEPYLKPIQPGRKGRGRGKTKGRKPVKNLESIGTAPAGEGRGLFASRSVSLTPKPPTAPPLIC